MHSMTARKLLRSLSSFLLLNLSAYFIIGAITHPSKFGDNSSEDFRIISGVLRLANKYVIDGLRSRALDHLSIAWPATLKGWDAREEAVSNADERFYPNPVVCIPSGSGIHTLIFIHRRLLILLEK